MPSGGTSVTVGGVAVVLGARVGGAVGARVVGGRVGACVGAGMQTAVSTPAPLWQTPASPDTSTQALPTARGEATQAELDEQMPGW